MPALLPTGEADSGHSRHLSEHPWCLQIPEIVDLIFGELHWAGQRPHPTLAALARTCKVFHEPAIRHLWTRLDDLHPLFSLFPSWAWDIHEDEVEDKDEDEDEDEDEDIAISTVYPGFSFSDGDLLWTTFRVNHYTRHVKWISCKATWFTRDYKLQRLHHSTLQAIHRHPRVPHPVFPNALHLELFSHVYDPLTTVLIPPLALSPSVRTVHIVTDTLLSRDVFSGLEAPSDVTGPGWLGLGAHIADIAPQLSSLTVDMVGPEPLWAGRIPGLLDSFVHFSPSLSVLQIVPLVLSASAIMAIGQLSGLTILHLSLFAFQSSELDTLQPFSLTLLDKLVVFSNSLVICSKFFKALSARGLRKLEIGLLIPSDTNPAAFFTDLDVYGTYVNLEDVKIYRSRNEFIEEPHWYDQQTWPRFIFNQSTAQSLVPFKRIEKLSIAPCKTLEILDTDIRDMFASWPRLKVFELNDDNLVVDYQAPGLTLAGVHRALQAVPLLEKLALGFDGSALPPSTTPHPSLTSWDVCSSSVALPSRFAPWLSSNYPLLSTLHYFTTYIDGLKASYPLREDEDMVVDIDEFTMIAVMVDRWTSVSAKTVAKAKNEAHPV